MSDCCRAIQEQFDSDYASQERDRLERQGPIRTTRWLLEALVDAGVEGASILDVGAGLGAVTGGLVAAGASRATQVEASPAQSEAARAHAATLGIAGQVRFEVGDFVEIADAIEPADVVVLDRVLCCYPELDALLDASALKARRLYGAVYPKDTLPVRLVLGFENLWQRLRGNAFRAYAHPVARIESRLRDLGFRPRVVRRTLAWHVAVFERTQ